MQDPGSSIPTREFGIILATAFCKEKTATSPDLKEAFEAHLEETRGQIERLDQVCASLDEKVRGKHCDGIAGIIDAESMRLAIDRRPALMIFPLSRSLNKALRRMMALAGALLEVFGLVVVALEALQDLGDARFPFSSLRS